EGVVALVVAQRVGRRRAPFCHGDGGDSPAGDDAGVNRGAKIVNDLFDGDDAALGCQYGFLLYSDDPLDQHVALAVGTLGADHGDVGADGRHCRQALAGERAFDELDLVVDHGQIAADVTAQYRQRQAGRARFESIGHGGVTVFDQLQRPWPSGLDSITHAVQRADTGVAAPGKNELLDATGTDHLVVDQVRGHADERQITLFLADDLVPGGEGDQVGEAFHRDGVSVLDK